METRANYLLVASFVLAIVGLAAIGAIWLLNLSPLPESRAFYDIYFKGSVVGLKVDAPVSLSGIPIGNVRKIALDPDDPSQVHVTIEVQKGAATIKTDSVASLDVNFMFGDASISITGGSRSALPLAASPGRAYPIIIGQAQLQSIETQLADFMQRTIEVSDALIKMLDDRNRQSISEALQASEQATARAVGRTQDFGDTIDTADSIVRQAHAQIIGFNASLLNITQGLDNASADLKDMDAVVKEVGDWARDFDSALSATRQQQVAASLNTMRDLEGAISDARALVGRFARYIDDLGRDPSRALFGKPSSGGYRPP